MRSLLFASGLLCTLAPLAAGQTGPLQQTHYIKSQGYSQWFGHALDLDGDTLVIGAPGDASNYQGIFPGPITNDPEQFDADRSGAVHVYRRSGTTWKLEAYIKASNGDGDDLFGHAVAINGDLLVVGAPGEDSESTGINSTPTQQQIGLGVGAAYIYRRTGTTWNLEAYVKADFVNTGDEFGASVDVEGDLVVIGAPGEDAAGTLFGGNPGTNYRVDSGAVYAYAYDGSAWSLEEYFKAAGSDAGDAFGAALALRNGALLVGAPGVDSGASGVDGDVNDNSTADAGAAFTFYRSGTSWSYGEFIKASNPAANNEFGAAVAIDAAALAIGAPGEAGASTSINGSQVQGGKPDSGAVYVFERPLGDAPMQAAHIKALNSDAGDRFGTSLDLHGGSLVVGAPWESSSSPANKAQDDLLNSGAAYQYNLVDGVWRVGKFFKASNPAQWSWYGYSTQLDGERLLVGARIEGGLTQAINGKQFNLANGQVGAVYGHEVVPASCGTTLLGAGVNGAAQLNTSTLAIQDSAFAVNLTGFASDGPALLAVSLGQVNQPGFGGTLFVDATQMIPAPGAFLPVPIQNGIGEFEFQIPVAAAGLQAFLQAGKLDLGLPSGIELTNGLAVTVCP